MEAKSYQASLLNSYAAADIATDTSTNPSQIRIPGLLPMAIDSIRSVNAETAVDEVSQVWTLGVAVTPIITASTRYQVYFGDNGSTQQAMAVSWKPRGYTSPPVLTSSAATDRHNAYVAIANQINNDPIAYATAYPLVTVAYDAQAANFTVGETVTDGTTGATGIVVADVDAGATGTLTVGQTGNYTLTFNDNNAITGSVSGSATINGNGIVGVGLRVVDDAGYYTPGTQRVGPNSMMATIGFSPAMLTNTTAGVVPRGQGEYLALDVPLMEVLSDNLRSGTWSMATNQAPITTAEYTKVVIIYNPYGFTGPGAATQAFEATQILYLNEADADLAATLTALDALNP